MHNFGRRVPASKQFKGNSTKTSIGFWKPDVVGAAALFVAITNKDLGHACVLGAIAVFELIHF
jgi:hypothetical protein